MPLQKNWATKRSSVSRGYVFRMARNMSLPVVSGIWTVCPQPHSTCWPVGLGYHQLEVTTMARSIVPSKDGEDEVGEAWWKEEGEAGWGVSSGLWTSRTLPGWYLIFPLPLKLACLLLLVGALLLWVTSSHPHPPHRRVRGCMAPPRCQWWWPAHRTCNNSHCSSGCGLTAR